MHTAVTSAEPLTEFIAEMGATKKDENVKISKTVLKTRNHKTRIRSF